MLVKREISIPVLKAFQHYPVITITGPRQAGKTTLCKMLFPDKPYFSLEDPDTRDIANEDPRGFLSRMPQGGILDEVQNEPALLSYIQGIVDTADTNGRFILTGSNNFLLMSSISQSLAGRTALFKLLPFSVKEASVFSGGYSTEDRILKGLYPRALSQGIEPLSFFQNYVETYVERDVRQLINIKDATIFRKFLQLCSGRIGNLFDASSMANDIGISAKTVREWLAVLEQSYICFRLQPWHENRGKRLIKTAKLFFFDTGLAAYLCGIRGPEQLIRDPLRGSLFENLVIAEYVKRGYNSGTAPELYFYRDSNGIEVDLIIHENGLLYPVEIKSSATFHPDFIKSLVTFRERYPDKARQPCVIYGGKDAFTFKDMSIRGFLD